MTKRTLDGNLKSTDVDNFLQSQSCGLEKCIHLLSSVTTAISQFDVPQEFHNRLQEVMEAQSEVLEAFTQFLGVPHEVKERVDQVCQMRDKKELQKMLTRNDIALLKKYRSHFFSTEKPQAKSSEVNIITQFKMLLCIHYELNKI